MCDRIGCTHFSQASRMDFSGIATPSRRGFLKGAAAASTISMGLGAMGTAHAGAPDQVHARLGLLQPQHFLAHSRAVPRRTTG